MHSPFSFLGLSKAGAPIEWETEPPSRLPHTEGMKPGLLLGLAYEHVGWPGPQGIATAPGRTEHSPVSLLPPPCWSHQKVSSVILPGPALSDLFSWQLWLRVGQFSAGCPAKSRHSCGSDVASSSLLLLLLVLHCETFSRPPVPHC